MLLFKLALGSAVVSLFSMVSTACHDGLLYRIASAPELLALYSGAVEHGPALASRKPGEHQFLCYPACDLSAVLSALR